MTAPDYAALLAPLRLGHLTLRNRVFSTGHASGLAEQGMPGEAYRLYHGEKAKGGIGLTIFGGSSSVSADSPLAFSQIDMSRDRVVPYLATMAELVKGHGAAIMVQITHMGRRGGWRSVGPLPMVAPSYSREPAHRSFAKEMEPHDFRRIRRDFADAAARAQAGGLDGVEVMMSAHQLLDSFLSPVTNRRTDAYGGALANRARFPVEVLEAIRERTGRDFVVGIRMAGDEMQEGGLGPAECLEVAQLFAESGLVDYLSIYQATGDTQPDLARMLPDMTWPSAPFLHLASAVKAHVDVPVLHGSAVRDVATAARAVAEGHVDAIAMTRAHMADPHIVAKLREGRQDDIRPCVGANYCADFGGAAGGLCIHNAATGRERRLSHILPQAPARRRVVVAGGGPGGLEAARASLQRGHEVVLFEADATLGGQLRLAAQVPQRGSLAGIVRWLERQVRRGVELRLGEAASVEAVQALEPDAVFVATGGAPIAPEFDGADLCVPAWEVIAGRVAPARRVLVYDEVGLMTGIGCADMLARGGAEVELVSPDRSAGEETGALLHVAYYQSLYRHGATMTPNLRLVGARRDGNRLIALLRNLYTGADEEREVDQIVCEYGTRPRLALYDALAPLSRNLGELDQAALLAGEPAAVAENAEGAFDLYRIGDALVARDVHAAISDAARICRTI